MAGILLRFKKDKNKGFKNNHLKVFSIEIYSIKGKLFGKLKLLLFLFRFVNKFNVTLTKFKFFINLSIG